ncbi:NACHT domain-containing protein [Actinacidiphila sp. DG2A-62]|uniref:NACHT domain-containing protein n=1 Tax=Actinacidiphila sp. DG2A-62 TaxID=3108821 RepID=UPI002DBBB565|nr:NACHT domain-containing protein [Actinacidiphila sp. DG2A-62]MEC3996202.1 NACHT domain-containing protein [Actinacidiphila sp. DG2A-62]
MEEPADAPTKPAGPAGEPARTPAGPAGEPARTPAGPAGEPARTPAGPAGEPARTPEAPAGRRRGRRAAQAAGSGGRAPGPQAARLAVVRCGGRQGSGYLLTPYLVLTAAHVVEGTEEVRVTVPGPRGEVVCHRAGVWRRDRATPQGPGGVDVALVACERKLTDGSGLGWFEPWADITSLGPIPGCVAVGFPYVQRDAAGRLDTEQLTGTYKPGTGLFSGRGVLVLDGAPPAPRADGLSPLAGMSGAAVFAGGALLGVVAGDPHGWRHGRVTVTPAHRFLPEDGFYTALRRYGGKRPRLVPPPGQVRDEVAEFESRYAGYVAKRHETLRIFGIDVSRRGRAVWPLDAAYYSLEVSPSARRAVSRWHQPVPVIGMSALDPGPGDGPGPVPAGPVPAEQALAGHQRVLRRGVAGSGKSTLVQWLAVSAARQDLGEGLSHLRDLVPFVLPLRTVARRGALPAPAEFLSAVEAPMTAPPSWAERVLAEGRGLVLVDGLDEIDERARERVGDWLRGLLAAYPGNHWLVTSRPSAVEDSWLADASFTELTLSRMSRADVRAFTARWHEAARATVPPDRDGGTDTEELARIDAYERSLLDALRTKQDLARLATNPLMCALICALHRDRGGYLPTGRKELYDAALSMLLVRRDEQRELAPALAEAPQVQLLQKLAYWLVKNGQAEMDREDALGLIEAALPAMPGVAALGDAAAVYRYLLERSGLLRAPTTDSLDFVHRIFQDYLAARAAVEDRDFDLMARNAHHDQWADVIRMAVAHARPDERARLLKKIVARGDRARSHRARLHLLAMACLEHATELDPAVRALVEERGARLIPPRTAAEAEKLAEVGPMVLELLPGPEGLDDDEALAVARTAQLIGTDAAIAVLARFTGPGGQKVRHHVARFPAGVDRERYAVEILDRLPRAETLYAVDSPDELDLLRRIGGVEQVDALGSLTATDVLDRLADTDVVTRVDLMNPVSDEELRRLATLPRLSALVLGDCSQLTDLSPLAGLSLRVLSLLRQPPGLGLGALAGQTALHWLAVESPYDDWAG